MEAMIDIVFSLLLLTSIVGLVKPDLVIFWGQDRSRLKAFGTYFLLGMALNTAGAILTISTEQDTQNTSKESTEKVSQENTKAKEPFWYLNSMSKTEIKNKIKSLDEEIQKVRFVDRKDPASLWLLIYYLEDGFWDKKDYLDQLCLSLDSVFEKILRHGGTQKFHKILVFARSPTVDKYGNSETSLVMKLRFKTSELNKLNWDSMVPQRLLNTVGRIERRPLGTKVINSFCKTDSAKLAWAFCNKFAN